LFPDIQDITACNQFNQTAPLLVYLSDESGNEDLKFGLR